MSEKQTSVWDRLSSVSKTTNLEELAAFLGINASTLRGRKSRGSVPYKNIVQKLDGPDLLYVLKGEETTNKFTNVNRTKAKGSYKASTEIFLAELINRLKDGPFSQQVKIQIVDALIDIVEKDLAELDRD